MPPRVKKPAATPTAKKTGRATRGMSKLEHIHKSVKVEEVTAVEAYSEAGEDVMVEENDAQEKSHFGVGDLNAEPEEENKPKTIRSASLKKEEAKETADHERLDLEDNEPEYEPEDYGHVDYDEKEADEEDALEEDEEVSEEVEEGDVSEEDDMGEDDVEYVEEELGDEEDEHVPEEHEHPEFANAEEEQEHHEHFKERRKRKEFEIFVGGLDKDATEEDLKKVFSAVGEVIEVRLMMNPQTKKNKGFAFLRYASVEQAKRAVAELKNPVVKGKQCGVTPSRDSDTLFLGNICKTWTKEALEKKLRHYGIENIEDMSLVEDSNNQGINRGFAFLEFSSRSDAMEAFKRLQKRDVVFGVDRPAKVSFADPFVDPGDEIMAQVKTVFVDGIPASWDEDHVRNLLMKHGQVEKIELARNMPSARRKDFGFVTFDTHDAALNCAKNINNSELGEDDKKAKVRARLSRPLQKGKGRPNARGNRRAGRPGQMARAPWNRFMQLPPRGPRRVGGRIRPASGHSLKRPIGIRDSRPAIAAPVRARPFVPPNRSYDRRAPVVAYPKSSSKRNHPRREELPPRSRAASGYGSRMAAEMRKSSDYSSRPSGYADLPRRGPSRPAPRKSHAGETYVSTYDRPPPSYREARTRARDYDYVSGSKRLYNTMDDVPPRYSDTGARHSRARLDYDAHGGASRYGDYGDRLGNGTLGFSGGRTSLSSQDSHRYYSSRQEMGYGGSYSGSEVGGGMYSSSFAGDYVSRGPDVGGSSYSSLYSSRGLGGNGYMGSGNSRSYY